MRFTTVFATATAFATATLAAPSDLGVTFSASNHYGAPLPPWQPGCKPGWYYGDHPSLVVIVGLPWLKDGILCALLDLLPLNCLHCPKPPHNPPPSDGWKQTFHDSDGAVQADDYLTFGLVDTVDDCKTMCLNVDGCNFFNTYHDVNGKDGSPQLTCALFAKCHTEADATNKGGQTQPDGSVDSIAESAGYCKV